MIETIERKTEKTNFGNNSWRYKEEKIIIPEQPQKFMRGQIWWADLGDYIGSVQGGLRPVVIIQNDKGNKHSPTLQVVPLTSKMSKNVLPTHVIMHSETFLESLSLALIEQTRPLDGRIQMKEYLGNASEESMKNINIAMEVEMGLRKEFDINECYKLLVRIKNAKKTIEALKNNKSLSFIRVNSIKEFDTLTNEFNDLCKKYNKNPDFIKYKYINEYLIDKIASPYKQKVL